MSARERILGRVRAALADVPYDETPQDVPVVRDYFETHPTQGGPGPDRPEATVDLLAENLADYRAVVHRSTAAELPAVIARLLADRGSRTVAVPLGLPADWLTASDAEQLADSTDLTAARLDEIDSVVTGCALAIAETGTLVLDAGPGQGRRILTLIPDHHICVVRTTDQVVASVPQALPRLDPIRPQTWISGPSATSDIELDRVEGVHGPRALEVILVGG
ncbi:LutC/YkgG family protein [Streptomyces sp. H27-D2]|uniref:LutC/YkgG family protein n=1 Tax=Streptomyces sp. H27-D2 TaxID=3046304 RepID=UPI002DB86A8B|nr:lactate utilization protein C [Streptomyces sp. H27-D2]MEC4021149.1 lactate utilization protein C [Streptomyces sp. H27-D2]